MGCLMVYGIVVRHTLCRAPLADRALSALLANLVEME